MIGCRKSKKLESDITSSFCINSVTTSLLNKFSTRDNTYYQHYIVYNVNFDYLGKSMSTRFLHYGFIPYPHFHTHLFGSILLSAANTQGVKNSALPPWDGGKFILHRRFVFILHSFIHSFSQSVIDVYWCEFIDIYFMFYIV